MIKKNFFPREYFLFLSLLALSLGPIYIVFLSDSGYWLREEIKEKVARTESSIHYLKKENHVLYEKYFSIKNKGVGVPAGGEIRPSALDPATIVIQFSGIKAFLAKGMKKAVSNNSYQMDELNIKEARVIFLTFIFLIGLIGIYFIRRYLVNLEKKETIYEQGLQKTKGDKIWHRV